MTVTDMGFPRPTDSQAAAIPPLLELRDVVGIGRPVPLGPLHSVCFWRLSTRTGATSGPSCLPHP